MLTKQEPPFAPNWFEHPDGRMHYTDEGTGPPILFVHGTPTSSYLYRHTIEHLRSRYRCIAPDHLGYGLSEKPSPMSQVSVDYSPRAHSRRLGDLVDALELDRFTLVVHDFGGPIGLGSLFDEASGPRRIEKLDRLVLFNTWAWSNADRKDVQRLVRFLDGPIGRFLYYRLNASTRFLLPSVFFDKKRLTREAHRYYQSAFPTPASRRAPHEMGRHLIDPWIADLEEQLPLLRGHATLLLWGMHDPTFKPADLERWRQKLPDARVEELEAGHFPQEEAPQKVNDSLAAFLG